MNQTINRDSKGRFAKKKARPFKVGDIVKRLDYECYMTPGTIGKIIKSGNTITVLWNTGVENEYYDEHHRQLELVPNTPKQKKPKKEEPPRAFNAAFRAGQSAKDAEIATLKAEVEMLAKTVAVERDLANDLLSERNAAEAKLADIRAIYRTNILSVNAGTTDILHLLGEVVK